MRATRFLLIALLLAAAWPVSGQHTASPPRIAQVPPMRQGGIQRLRVEGAGDAIKVSATAFHRTVPLGNEGNGVWEGLLGVDVLQKPGLYPVAVMVTRPEGRVETLQITVDVKAGRFATRRLRVSQRFTDPAPGDAARMTAEAVRLNALFEGLSDRLWQGAFQPPVPGEATSNFGSRSIFNGRPRAPHAGIDYRGQVGTPVAAPNAGRVVLAEELFLTGNTVVLDHGLGLYSVFAHLSRMDVNVGDTVSTASAVGLVGATGRVTGPHLHWSVRLGTARVDPSALLLLAPSSP
jgi:murein DD-endopeptidase MepM/ murein hydrolase activator NlpD